MRDALIDGLLSGRWGGGGVGGGGRVSAFVLLLGIRGGEIPCARVHVCGFGSSQDIVVLDLHSLARPADLRAQVVEDLGGSRRGGVVLVLLVVCLVMY